MNIKILCPCGTKFAFDIEPVNGRMPLNVNCPGCNQSALELANAEIRRQLTAVSAAPPAAPTPAPAPAPAPGPVVSMPATPGAPKLSIPTRPAAPAPSAPVAIPQIPATPAPAPVPAPAPAPAPAAVASTPALLVPQPPPQSSLRISKPAAEHAAPAAAPAPEAAPAAPGVQLCHRHKNETATESCRVCGKPICPKCMETFGYVCSVYCRQQATAKGIPVPVYAHQKIVVEGKSRAVVQRLVYAGVALGVVFLGLWIWYDWFARDPKVVYKVEIHKSDSRLDKFRTPNEFYSLIGPNQLLSVKNKKLILTDVTQQKELWSARLQTDAEVEARKAAKEKNEKIMKLSQKRIDPETGMDLTNYKGLDPLGFDDEFLFESPNLVVTTNDIWISFPDRLLRFDRQTGGSKDVPVKEKIKNARHEGNTLLVVSGEPSGRELLTQINLADGSSQSDEIAPAKTKPAGAAGKNSSSGIKPAATNSVAKTASVKTTPAKGGKSPVNGTRTADMADSLPAEKLKAAASKASASIPSPDDDEMDFGFFGGTGRNFIAAGPNVVQFETKELEHKTIAHEAMKKKAKSIMESGNLTAGQSLDAAQEVLNDMQRQTTGGMEQEDVSRYQVTVHRRFAGGAQDFTGEVVGPPQFIPLKTVDIVAAGHSFLVLDKNNKKLWEAKLTYTIPKVYHYGFDEEEHFRPCLETKDALYVADQGILTRYDLATGNVVWRLNSVGVSKIQEDAKGRLYVTSTTAGPDSIKYSQQINVHEKIRPIIMKVDNRTGKVLWRLESVGDDFMLSGKFVYSTRISQAVAWLKLEEGPDMHYNLNLINPSNGHSIWNYHQGNRHVRRTEVRDNWIMIHFEDGVEVLKFFSL